MLTKSGVTLLDFGLAKATAPIAGAGLSMLPTTRPELTAQGAILGTLQYMAPSSSRTRDRCADGHLRVRRDPARDGHGQAGVRGTKPGDRRDHVESACSPLSLQPLTPTALDHIVARCLTKNVDDRWQSAHDLKLQRTWIAEGKSTSPAVTASVAVRSL